MAVEFEEQGFGKPVSRTVKGGGAVTNLIFKLGLAKTPAQANVIMLVIAVIAVSITVYLFLPARVVAPVPSPAGEFLEPGTLP